MSSWLEKYANKESTATHTWFMGKKFGGIKYSALSVAQTRRYIGWEPFAKLIYDNQLLADRLADRHMPPSYNKSDQKTKIVIDSVGARAGPMGPASHDIFPII